MDRFTEESRSFTSLVGNEVRFLGQVGAALWSETERGAVQVGEAIELASAGSRLPEARIEVAARTLIDRARAAGTLAFRNAVGDPFWRIPLELRFLLAASHGPWRASYVRLQRTLSARVGGSGNEAFDEDDSNVFGAGSGFSSKQDTSPLQQLLWSARTQFAAALGIPLVRGAVVQGLSCPEYQSREPWTQRFLDDELSARERMYLQNHLMSCQGCRAALDDCRRLLAAIEAQLLARGVIADAVAGERIQREQAESAASVLAWSSRVLWIASFVGVAALLLLLLRHRG